ncbi:BRO family protein [Halanaerobium saccharolyticum]|jgi:prophage antirepressor-like protein|uniref:BRO family protein n=1 Tax=Halanaerobium saccharolyticum TaxID=43595 RepID=A0A4R6LE49_9FIRM|nr:BRO family protein [Halanaerobium saccharolyticum]TDO77727.1 BRO family protein [Halanaerobium saccharolyticum]
MSNIKIFENKNFGEVRTLKRNDQVLFVAKDVCDSLDIKNTTDAVKRLDADEVTRLNLGGRVGETNLVNEFGLYNLVLGSRKPEAKKFKRWITHEVIPEIRKTGQYISKPNSVEDLIIMQAESVKELKQKVDHQEKQIETIKGAIIHTDEDWRNWVNQQINSIAFRNKNYREIRKQSYDILENRARCRLDVRLNNLKDRLEQAGAKKSKIRQVNKLDVIEEEPRLKEIYTMVVEKLVIKYSA